MARIDEATLIEGTIADLEKVIQSLIEESAALTERIGEAEARRDAWKARLKQLTAASQGKERLKKGAALEAIHSVFDDAKPGSGLTVSEISKNSGIAWSSIRNAIRKPNSGYHELNGAWLRTADVRNGSGLVQRPLSEALREAAKR